MNNGRKKHQHILKSTVEEIKARFDKDVDRFSNLETGQTSTIDAVISMNLITKAAARINPEARIALDIGCGAGNYSVKLSQELPFTGITLIDLSLPMLERAKERLEKTCVSEINLMQGDIRELELPENYYDIVMAAAVFHHLRSEDEWVDVFKKIYKSMKAGGSFWISDLVVHETDTVNEIMMESYKNYLYNVGGSEYANAVLDCIEMEDTPRSLHFQLQMLEKTGFSKLEILHKNACYAAFGGIK
ncbi:MAG: class I SAM-dependent methyltransferase [Bacteroidales bacterium]|nr:class I SAM-dependent methyltransferase [Bacteroidales bacterium]